MSAHSLNKSSKGKKVQNVHVKSISIHCVPSFCSFIQALIESNFLWDSSISTKTTDKPIWPYTLDYAIPHECKIKSCPTKVSRVVGFTRNIF